jgi:hypothetical protein
MATKKTTTKKAEIPLDEKLDRQEFDMFKAIEALDRKDYNYYANLSEEQQKKFTPFMLLQWMSCATGSKDIQSYYLLNTELTANKHFLEKSINDHPELQWKLLCSISPGHRGKVYHKWIPQLKKTAQQLRVPITVKEATDYMAKLFPDWTPAVHKNAGTLFAEDNKHKCWLAEKYPELKAEDIEVLSTIFTAEDAKNYEKQSGN